MLKLIHKFLVEGIPRDLIILRLASPFHLFIAVFVFLVLATVSGVCTKEYPVTAALIAISGVLFGIGFKLHDDMRSKAMKVMQDSRANSDFRVAAKEIAKFFRGKTFTDKYIKLCVVNAYYCNEEIYDEDRKIISNIIKVANFYEEIAIYIKYREVYEPILEDYYRGSFLKFYNRTFRWIAYLRLEMGENLYNNMEMLYKIWSNDKSGKDLYLNFDWDRTPKKR